MNLSNALNRVDHLTGFLLDMGDRPFFEYHFTNALNNQLRRNNKTEPTAKIVEIATKEALQRTWQDDNGITKAANTFRDALYRNLLISKNNIVINKNTGGILKCHLYRFKILEIWALLCG